MVSFSDDISVFRKKSLSTSVLTTDDFAVGDALIS